MTTPFENFVNIALGKSVSADVTLPTADEIPVFTGIGRQVTGKTKAELGLALSADLDTDGTLAANSDTKYPSQKAVKTYADTKQAALGNVITANTYGSSTQYPIVTVNAKGIVTGITLQTVAAPATFSDSAFRIQDNDDATKQIEFEVSGVDAGETKTITMPNADINLGNLSSVATTDFNTLSGTSTRILGGSHNTVSGTDNVVIGCTSVTTSSSLGQYIQASSGSTAGIDWPTRFIGNGTLRGTTDANTELATVITHLKAFNIYDTGSAVLTTDGGAATTSNTPKHAGACPHDDAASNVATHELDLQVVTRFNSSLYVNTGITHAKYLISVLDTAATATLVSTCSNGTVATFTVTPTVVSGRLYITVANTTGSDKPVRVRGVLKSLYSYL